VQFAILLENAVFEEAVEVMRQQWQIAVSSGGLASFKETLDADFG